MYAIKIIKDNTKLYFLGVILKETTITFPANKEGILETIENTLEAGTRLACFGHIPSNYPVVMPVEEIVKLCHSKGVPVLIDGAHALGSLPLNLTGLEADYYVANAHKWLACPKVLCNVSECPEEVILCSALHMALMALFYFMALYLWHQYTMVRTYLLVSWQGCAFLHVSKQHQAMIKPLVVSAGFGAGFNSQFIWTGL